MSTNQQETNRRSDVVRCEFCGEDYAVTYKRCPFCDGKKSKGGSGGRVASGGKRVAINARGGGYGSKGMEPVHVIGIVLSIILIIAALYIVYTVVSPLLGFGKPSGSASISNPGISQSQPGPGVSQSGDVSSSGDISQPGPLTPGSSSVITPVATATSIKLSSADFTLNPDAYHQLKVTLTPSDCTDTVVWSSSDESLATVTQDGTVTNVNKGSSLATATITAQVGDLTATCKVRCKPGSTGGGTGTGTGTGSTVAVGSTGVVTGANSGLRIRSGPGTSYTVLGSATNGALVTVLEDTGSGWLKVNYVGASGKTETGYVSKDYIKIK